MAIVIMAMVVLCQALTTTANECPAKCICNKPLTHVKCSARGLTSVPSDIPTSVTHLYLDHNHIHTIASHSLSRLSHLMSLFLESNLINRIEPYAFTGTSSLEKIYLEGNHLEFLDADSFYNSTTITFLHLGSNKFSSIPPLGHLTSLKSLTMDANKLTDFTFPLEFKSLKSLRDITLSNNDVKALAGNEFVNLGYSGVRTLMLSRSNIKQISNTTFLPLTSLQSLKIAHNPIDAEQLRNAVISLRKSPLVSINIGNLMLGGQLPSSTFELFRQSVITDLIMPNNRISSVPDRAFAEISKLRQLDISASTIGHISSSAFEGLKSLTILKLNDNKLLEVPDNLPVRLNRLYLSGNQITRISNGAFSNLTKLEELNLSSNKILTLDSDAFFGLVSVHKLHIASNRIASLPGKLFMSLSSLRSLDMSRNNLARIDRTYGLFSAMTNLINLDISNNNCYLLPLDIFRPLESLENLHVENNRLNDVFSQDNTGLFRNLKKLQRLYAANNSIHNFGSGLFNDSLSVRYLDFNGNKLTHIRGNIFPSKNKVQTILVSYNLISVISSVSLDNLKKLHLLNLTGNPFACTCDQRWFRDWIKTTNVSLPDLDTYRCNTPPSWNGKLLLSFDKSKIDCVDKTLFYILAGCAGTCVITLIFSIVCYRKRWSIQLGCYRFKTSCCRSDRNGYLEIPGEDKVYDAYISCSENDYRWVADNLLPCIDNRPCLDKENHGTFSLCFEHRDRDAGRGAIGYIEESIRRSRYALIVLTENYTQSKRHEFELERIKEAKYGENPLIQDYHIIKVGNIKAKHIPKLLCSRMEQNDFSEWEDNPHAISMFENRLKQFLSGGT